MAYCLVKTHTHSYFSQNEYIQQPLELVRVMQNCLVREAELVERQEQLSVCTVYWILYTPYIIIYKYIYNAHVCIYFLLLGGC